MTGRVHGRRAFERFRAEGRRIRSGDLWCVMVADDTCLVPHVAYAIGRSVGPAVVRNRIRRRLRSLVSRHESDLPAGWYLVGVQPSAVMRSYQELDEMLQQLVKRTKS